MLRLLKVTENSLHPAYQDGDYVLTSRIPILFKSLRPGEAVVFRQEIYGTLIKLVERVDRERQEIYVIGLREESVDSRRFGPIHYKDIIGKVIWHIPKPGG
jgi:hypothetical protein